MREIFYGETIQYGGSVHITKDGDDYDFNVSNYLYGISSTQALALADAIYKAEGLGWLPYPERTPEEFGMYEVTLSEGLYRVRAALWDGGIWTLKDVIAFRKPRPYESEVE
jgi:hypothetical protein